MKFFRSDEVLSANQVEALQNLIMFLILLVFLVLAIALGAWKGKTIWQLIVNKGFCCTLPDDDDESPMFNNVSRNTSNRGSMRQSKRETLNNPFRYQPGEDDKSLARHHAYFAGSPRNTHNNASKPPPPLRPPQPPPPKKEPREPESPLDQLDEREIATPRKIRRLQNVSFSFVTLLLKQIRSLT